MALADGSSGVQGFRCVGSEGKKRGSGEEEKGKRSVGAVVCTRRVVKEEAREARSAQV